MLGRTRFLILSGLLGLATAQHLHAIGAEEALRPVAHQEPPPAEVVRQKKAISEGEVLDDAQQLLTALRGLVLSPDATRALSMQSSASAGIHVEGFSTEEIAALQAALVSYLSQPVSLRSLDAMAARAEALLETTRGCMMRAAFPPQEITAGTVAMTIHPAKLGKITLRGSPAFGAPFIANSIRLRSGESIQRDRIAADLDWLNENPLRSVRAVFSPSGQDGRLDLGLQVDAERSWRVFSGIDNSLSDRLGDWRWYLGAQHGDLWRQDHRITLQATAGFDQQALHGGSLTYEMPLPWRHLLEYGISYSESRSARNSGTTLVDQSGQFQRHSLAYVVPLPHWHGWQASWRSGLTFRDQVYLLDATGPGGAAARRELSWHGLQVENGLTASRPDRLGTTRAVLRLLWNPGGTPLSSGDESFRRLAASDSDAWIAEISLTRTLSLKRAGMLSARLDGQWSEGALLAADQFAPAVFGRVRGFDEITGYGDNGASLSLEWATLGWKAGKAGSFRGLSFMEGALVHERATGADVELLATGVGIRWQWQILSLQWDLGLPLHSTANTGTEPRARFALTLRW